MTAAFNIKPSLYLVPVAIDLRKPVESFRTERVLPKATMDAAGNWITADFTLTRTERGLSDRRVGDETP